MLQRLNLEPLEERRRSASLVLMCKILNHEIAVPPEDLGLQRNPRATRGNYTQDKLIVRRTQTNELKYHLTGTDCQNQLHQLTTQKYSRNS